MNDESDDLNERVTALRLQIQELSALRNKRKFSRSRLNKYLEEILLMRFDPSIDASYQDIAFWLRKTKRIKVSHQAVHKFINKHVDELDATKYDFYLRD